MLGRCPLAWVVAAIILLLPKDTCSFVVIVTLPLSTRDSVITINSATRLVASQQQQQQQRRCCHRRRIGKSLAAAAAANDEDGNLNPGMSDAFRELESLGDDSNKSKLGNVSLAKPISVDTNAVTSRISSSSSSSNSNESLPLSPEKEAQMYARMMTDMETTDPESLYSVVMAETGGNPTAAAASVTSQFLSVPKNKDSAAPRNTNDDMETFMNNALKEALDEVKLKTTTTSVDSILNDKEFKKEIEAIFDRGSQQLMDSLEEIRKEQTLLAQTTAKSSAQAQAEADAYAEDAEVAKAERLAKAEKSMTAMLERITQEAARVEKAAQDLQKAQAELDKDFIVKLQKGGIPKQAAFVGFLLFSVRSIIDTITAFATDDEMVLAGALLQGGIALVCAIGFFLF